MEGFNSENNNKSEAMWKNVKIVSEGIGEDDDSGFSKSSNGSSFAENFLNIGEEKKIEELRIRVKDEVRGGKHKQRIAANRSLQEKYNEERRQQSYNRLMHLVTRSKFYSDFLAAQLTKNEREMIRSPNVEANTAILTDKKGKINNDENKIKGNNKRKKININENKGRVKMMKLNEEHIQELLSNEEDEKENISIEETDRHSRGKVIYVPQKYFIGELRDYQKNGLEWLKALYENAMGGILADEMGLGKTVQVIAMIAHLIEKKQTGPYLVIAPLSTIPNWIMEFERFAPKLPVIVYHGTENDRFKQSEKITKNILLNGVTIRPIVLTTYEMLLKSRKFFHNINWRYLVIDEAQRIKNCDTQLFKLVKDCKTVNRLLLTGTPLQNNLKELWSLLHFIMPDIFNDLAVFESWFTIEDFQNEAGTSRVLQQEEEKKVFQSFREILKPFMLRRLKSDVTLEIPAKKEVIVYAPMTKLQHDLYKALLNYDLDVLFKKKTPALIIDDEFGKRPKRKCAIRNVNSGVYKDPSVSHETQSNILIGSVDDSSVNNNNNNSSVMEKQMKQLSEYADITDDNRQYFLRVSMGNTQIMLRKIINHPYLIHLPLNDVGLPKIDHDLINVSGKLMVLDKMLTKLSQAHHRVLLFSTMKMILDIIEDYLSMKSWKYLRLDGSVNIDDRKESIRLFNNDPQYFIFLITTRAGGVGLNLAGADTVIIFDSDWNPQVDIQAMARCHRIGQNKPVVIYRLCTKGSYDEAIIARANAKRKLEKIVISKDIDNIKFNSKEGLLMLKELLHSNKEQTSASQEQLFTDQELDKIMDRRDLIG